MKLLPFRFVLRIPNEDEHGSPTKIKGTVFAKTHQSAVRKIKPMYYHKGFYPVRAYCQIVGDGELKTFTLRYDILEVVKDMSYLQYCRNKGKITNGIY